jgi:hypothetical protein
MFKYPAIEKILAGSSKDMGPLYKEGDRIEMILMENDPRPIEPGTKGTVLTIHPIGNNESQMQVKWDNGRSLMVLLPHDKVKKI